MADLTLFLGNKAYSSWSLRAWLALEHVGAPYKEVIIPLEETRTTAIRAHSPSGKVPALRDGDLVVWDSLAIGEYLAESYPDAKLWPGDRAARAIARSVSAEMHSGFPALRSLMPMNVRRDPIVLGPDHPTTGGYPILAVIVRADLGRFHAHPIGVPVRFVALAR